ncbi:MAG: DUF4367 domain-containing protein [Lachnospiraceae bacterium]|nr:DUF4367 domain-containing protein [Lachnospiraceae bacterium]
MKKPTVKKKKRKISDAEFDAALRKALEQRNRDKVIAPPPEEESPKEHHFSEEFDKKIMKMFDDYQDQFIPHTRNTMKKSWVLAATFFIVLGITINAGASKIARTRFAIGNHPDHSEVNYEFPDMSLAPKEILEYREPDWGEEYEEIGRVESKTSVIINMSKKNTNLYIKFSQLILSISEPYINTEYVDLEKDLLELKNGKTAYSLNDSGLRIIFWNDGEYYYELQGNCEIKELIQLANKLHIS